MRAFILLFLISFNAMAMNWFDMDRGETFTLQQDFQLKQKERSGSMLDFSKGDKFILKGITGGAGLGLFVFHYPACPGPAMETEIEIIPVIGTAPLKEVGVMVAEGCELWVYVELRDFWTKSLFE